MSEHIDINRRHLLNILLKDYEFIIQGISVRESNDIPNEVKLDTEFRVNVKDGEGLQKFLLAFSKSSETSDNTIKEIRQIKLARGQFCMCMVCESAFIV